MTVLSYDYVSDSIGNKPRVGYRNLFRSGVVSVSSEDEDHPKQLAYDGFTYDGWRATGGGSPNAEWIQVQVTESPAESANYMSIAAHTLAGAQLTPQRSNDGSSWTNLANSYTARSNRPIVWEWTDVAADYWRLLIEGGDTVQIGAIHVGRKLEMQRGLPVGWRPPSLNELVTYTNTGSEGGQSLGRSVIRRGASVEVDLRHSEYAWTMDEWLAFIDEAEQYALFFWWENEGKAEVIYGQLSSRDASFSTEHLVTPRFKLDGITR